MGEKEGEKIPGNSSSHAKHRGARLKRYRILQKGNRKEPGDNSSHAKHWGARRSLPWWYFPLLWLSAIAYTAPENELDVLG